MPAAMVETLGLMTAVETIAFSAIIAAGLFLIWRRAR